MVVYLNSGAATRPASRTARPLADAYRDGDDYVLAIELPGVDPSTIDIDVTDQVLTIKAERSGAAGEGVSWIARERSAGTLQRRFTLGRSVDTDAITANSVNGVLHVVLPISEAAKPRKVEVSTSAGAAEQATAPEVEAPAA